MRISILIIFLLFPILGRTLTLSEEELSALTTQCKQERGASISTLIVPPSCQKLDEALASKKKQDDLQEELSKLTAQCKKERDASLSTLIVPESCRRLDEALALKNNQNKPETDDDLRYQWYGDRYCYLNSKGAPVSCFTTDKNKHDTPPKHAH